MDEFEREKLHDQLAIEVMNWRFDTTTLCWVPNKKPVCLLDTLSRREWQPMVNYNHTAMIRDRILHEINFDKHDGATAMHHRYNPYTCNHEVKFDWSSGKCVVHFDTDYRVAVCRAALKAVISLTQ